MSKISRGNLGEKKVAKELEKIKEYHRLFNDVTFINPNSEVTHQMDHIYIHPHGVFVIETKNYYGSIEYNPNNNVWTKTVNGVSQAIPDPLRQNKSHAVNLYKILNKKYKVIPVLVFVKDNAPYFDDENIINLSDLILLIESYPYESELSKEEIDEISDIISQNIYKVNKSEHLENISYVKQIKKEQYAEKIFAIERGLCPWCHSPIINEGYKFHCSKCNFKFKL